MTFVRDLVGSGLVIGIIIVFQYFMIRVIGPDTMLFEMASSANRVNGAAHANFWFELVVLWIPLIGHFTALALPFVRNYRTNLQSGVAR